LALMSHDQLQRPAASLEALPRPPGAPPRAGAGRPR
jgi:hypothetical protein